VKEKTAMFKVGNCVECAAKGHKYEGLTGEIIKLDEQYLGGRALVLWDKPAIKKRLAKTTWAYVKNLKLMEE
jgi:hypothetical protein